ncbi:protein of unknown function [Nitrosotalea devaniterrae]|uniref:Uncharacterized protein n=1 Tax=Nitrosotalea devaniterrae TaxID=1078905 RepID=A0A128A0Z7_9ARCH|nr:protein of unknown function [Candidatus Nitrosotalea devanaterra]
MAIAESADSIKKRVNTTNPLVLTDEDCIVQSDVGKKLTYKKTIYTKTQTIRKKPTKKAKLLAIPDVKRWYDNVARGSPVSAEINLRRLSKFCEDNKITPTQLAELGIADVRKVTDLLQDQISWMESQGKAPQYIKGTITAIKSWLHHFDVFIKRRIKITDVDSTPTLANERVPEGYELAELFSRANLRAGAVMSLIGKAGLRPEVLGNHNATDGLMIKDLPDLEIKHGMATFSNKPSKVLVRKTLSKARHEYFTFLTDLGGKSLLAYLNERIVSGEMLTPESPVIAPFAKYERFRGENKGKRFVETLTIRREVQKIMRPRFLWRPYVLRAYFDTQLLIAESRGKIAHDFRVFFMGHKGSMEAKYTTNKGILPDLLINEMRNAFSRSEEFLDLEKVNDQQLKKQKETTEKLGNLTQEELELLQKLLAKIDNSKTSMTN